MERSSGRRLTRAGLARVAALGAAAVVVLVGLAPGAGAGRPGTWTRISDPTGSNTDEVGIARTPDGVLHVAWTRKDGDKADLMQTAIARSGRVIGTPSAIATGWSSIANPALVASRDGGLRVVFGGIRSTDAGETNTSMNTATAGPSGRSWTLVTGSIVKSTSAYASSAGATLEQDGTPVTAWATTYGLGVHVGLDPTADDQILQTACCAYQPQLTTDVSSGQVVLGWVSNATGASGIVAQAVTPAGPKQTAPGSASSPDAAELHTAIRARLGAPGVYLAYCGGGTTFCRDVLLWRYGGGAPLAVAKAPDSTTDAGERVMLAPGPQGRLWVAWERGGRIYAVRTNRTVTRVGATVSTAPPRGMKVVWKLDGDGAEGPLDLLASVGPSASSDRGIATWHTQLLPGLTLTVRERRLGTKRRLVLTVTDAGDPVAGATIRIAAERPSGMSLPKSRRTDAKGRAVLVLARGGARLVLSLTARHAGYVAATRRAVVR